MNNKNLSVKIEMSLYLILQFFVVENILGLKMQKVHQNQKKILNAQNEIMKHTVRKD